MYGTEIWTLKIINSNERDWGVLNTSPKERETNDEVWQMAGVEGIEGKLTDVRRHWNGL